MYAAAAGFLGNPQSGYATQPQIIRTYQEFLVMKGKGDLSLQQKSLTSLQLGILFLIFV